MKMSIKLYNKKMKIKDLILYLPTPVNINILWNFGSILGIFLTIQIISGLFLSMHYTPNVNNAFNSIINIMHNINYGWVMRLIHMNGASLFFFCMFIHIIRGLYFNLYYMMFPWLIGSLIFIFSMMTAFLGYVLPWGQMSYWGATVITNLVSAIPFIGNEIVMWMWGGFSVNNSTLNRFYSLHFILPFIIVTLILGHLIALHVTGSNNPLGVKSDFYKISFHIYFTIKDIQGFIFMLFILMITCYMNPYMLNDPENFTKANFMITPVHIQPEWYFLFAYTILRSIPNKLGGVMALMMSIMIIMFLPFFIKYNFKNMFMLMFNQILFWSFILVVSLLTWIGTKPIEYPYMLMGQILTLLYFFYYFMTIMVYKFWENKMYN